MCFIGDLQSFFSACFQWIFFRFLWWKLIFALQLCFLLISVMNPRSCTMSLGHNFPWYWTTCRVYKSWKEDQTSAHFKDMSRRTNNMLVAVVLIATLTSSVSIQNTSNVFEVSVMKFWPFQTLAKSIGDPHQKSKKSLGLGGEGNAPTADVAGCKKLHIVWKSPQKSHSP